MTPENDMGGDHTSLINSAEKGELATVLLPLVRIDQDNLAETLISLHETEAVDVLGAFSASSLAEVDQHDFFLLMMLYAEILPKINGDSATVMAITAGLVDRAGEDLAANEPYGAFRVWCANDDTRPASVLALIESAPQDYGRFVRFALETGAAKNFTRYVTEALRLVRHAESIVQLGALSALATMDLMEQPDIEEKVLAELQRLANDSANLTVMTNALGALIERCLAAGEHRISMLEQTINERLEIPLPLEQQVYARVLATHGASLPSKLLNALFFRLRRLDRKYGQIIEHLSVAFSRHGDAFGIERTSRELITILHESGGAVGLNDFRTLSHNLRSSAANELRGRLLLDALHQRSLRASHDIGSFFTEINGKHVNTSFDFTALGITDDEIIAVCRRASVVLALAPRATLDLFLSALDVVGKGAAAAIGDLLIEPVGLSYPETVMHELNERKKRRTSAARKAVDSAANNIKTYLEGIDRAHDLSELQPSTLERRAARHREFRSMRDSHAQAHEQSILSMIASRVDILYGNAVATYTPSYTANHPATRQEMRLSSMSISMEMPRLRTLDPTARLLAIQQFAEK